MSNPGPEDEQKSATRDELRTISFRLREIQRLLGVRAEQENRRLEAEGLDPVDESAFFTKQHDSEAESN